jgi:hypothetical protein
MKLPTFPVGGQDPGVVGEHSTNEGGCPPMADPLPGPRPNWIPGHSRRHERTVELDTRWIPACQCGWAFYSSVRSLRVADRTHGFHLDRVHASRHHAAS